MISSIQDIEYLFNNYGISGLSLIIIFFILLIINWICKNLFPYYFRKSKLEKMDEYKDKYIELNGYIEKTHVVNKTLEAEYGRILLNEKNISRQKTIIFLLHYNLCRTVKEAKKFATYLVFKAPQQSLVFNKSLSLSRTVVLGVLIVLFFSLFVYFRLEIKRSDTNFDLYMWFTLCILSYAICIIFCLISTEIIVNSTYAIKLIKKNPEIINKISSRLSELNIQIVVDTEENPSTDKLVEKEDEIKTLTEKLTIEKDRSKTEKKRREKLELITATTLLDKGVSIQDIAKIMEISVKKVEGILGKIK